MYNVQYQGGGEGRKGQEKYKLLNSTLMIKDDIVKLSFFNFNALIVKRLKTIFQTLFRFKIYMTITVFNRNLTSD